MSFLYLFLDECFDFDSLSAVIHFEKQTRSNAFSRHAGSEDGIFQKDPSAKRILVTGGAGFIGFHLAKALAENKDNVVIVLDSFNDYYDVKLKIVSFGCFCHLYLINIFYFSGSCVRVASVGDHRTQR
jgi:hypothetical protein